MLPTTLSSTVIAKVKVFVLSASSIDVIYSSASLFVYGYSNPSRRLLSIFYYSTFLPTQAHLLFSIPVSCTPYTYSFQKSVFFSLQHAYSSLKRSSNTITFENAALCSFRVKPKVVISVL